MWRLIINEGTAEENMALDETLLNLKDKGKISNTLRLYAFVPSAVTIGYSQKINEVVDIKYTEERNIPIVRRITGGGAVYHDQNGEITYSIISDTDDMPNNIQETFEKVCQGIVYALKEFKLEARFEPVNDVVANGKKISGSAQIRKKKALLQHGTIMYNTDIVTLGRLFKVPREKLTRHGAETIFDRVTTISRELNRTVTKKEVIESLIKGFSKALHTKFQQCKISNEENNIVQQVLMKYKGREWNYQH